MKRRWFYTGDTNIEHGGFFYCLDTWKDGYVDVVRCDPCSDAGGPDNMFWIEQLTVNLPSEEAELQHALGYAGADMKADYAKRTEAEKRHIIVYALVSHGAYDKEWGETVRIGGPDAFWQPRGEKFDHDTQLRGNSSLRNYVRRKCSTL